jgi:hypothetical protein
MNENRRRIHTLIGEVEYLPAPTRRVSSLHVEAEVLPGPHRRVSSLMVEVEYIPTAFDTGRLLNARVMDIKGTLQDNPNANIDAKALLYKRDIETVFGVKFTNDAGAVEWGIEPRGFLALHFARLGLEASAQAFENWIEKWIKDNPQSTSLIPAVDRYGLFRRVFGSLEFRNTTATKINVAQASGRTISVHIRPLDRVGYVECYTVNDQGVETIHAQIEGRLNEVNCEEGQNKRQAYQRDAQNNLLPGSEQWVMTPNNLIHEIGHVFDGLAGFGEKKFGSLENAINNSIEPFLGGDNLHAGRSRKGMGEGRDFLRELFHEHTRIVNAGNNVVDFQSPLGPPFEGDADYHDFVPERYLFHDIAESQYGIWQSVYSPVYGDRTRIDTLVHNKNFSYVETAADAFLNWVRHTDALSRPTFVNKNSSETNAAAWIAFFANNGGLFLRNAVIHNIGMLPYYQAKGIVGAQPILVADKSDINRNVRITPNAGPGWDDRILYDSESDNLPHTLNIFGLIKEDLGEGSAYWVLTSDISNRLVWTASLAIAADVIDLDAVWNALGGNFDRTGITPIRPVDGFDIEVIVGVRNV